MSGISEFWFKLLSLFEQSNHQIQNSEWSEVEISDFYSAKDQFLELLVKLKLRNLKVNLYYIPYFKYCNLTKDKAGILMRNDSSKKPFEYYLSLVEPCSYDKELMDKATIELEILSETKIFSFHIPFEKSKNWDIDLSKIPKKPWISRSEFKRFD